MIDSRIVPALVVMGLLTTALYTAAWWQLVDGASEPPRPAPATAGPDDDDDRLYYRVTTAKGQQHVIDVSRIDAASAVLTATERYGAGSTVERLEPAAAAQARQQAHRQAAAPSPLTWTGLLILMPLSLLLAAARLRARDASTRRVWSAVSPTLCSTGDKLMAEARVDAATLQRTLDAINAWRRTELRWDRNSDRIMDLRLAHFTLTVRYCPRCNAQLHARMSADLSQVPSCDSCMAPLDGRELDEQQEQVVHRLVGEEPRDGARDAGAFSTGAFIFWSLLFPPLAAAYAMRAAR